MSSSLCTSCSGGKYASGSSCLSSCPVSKYAYNFNCLSLCPANTKTYGHTCVTECPSGTYLNNAHCLSNFYEFSVNKFLPKGCSTLDASCTKCSSYNTCDACSGDKLAYGSTCVSSCPSKNYEYEGLCVSSCPEGTKLEDEECVTMNTTNSMRIFLNFTFNYN